jgi:hypothetical protein
MSTEAKVIRAIVIVTGLVLCILPLVLQLNNPNFFLNEGGLLLGGIYADVIFLALVAIGCFLAFSRRKKVKERLLKTPFGRDYYPIIISFFIASVITFFSPIIHIVLFTIFPEVLRMGLPDNYVKRTVLIFFTSFTVSAVGFYLWEKVTKK